MIQSFENIDLADEPLALFLGKMFLIYYLDGSQGLGLLVQTLSDLSKCTYIKYDGLLIGIMV